MLLKAKELENIICRSNISFSKKSVAYKEYLDIIKRGAYNGIAEAQYQYGQQFEHMSWLYIQNPKYNPRKTFYWYSKACNKNHPAACNNLAYHYETGLGCKKNITKALKLYKKAAELGDYSGKKNYSIMLRDTSPGGKYHKTK